MEIANCLFVDIRITKGLCEFMFLHSFSSFLCYFSVVSFVYAGHDGCLHGVDASDEGYGIDV